jgi:cell division septation protein DedD
VGRAPIPHLLALVCGLALIALAATGCGGDRSNLIPSQRAQDLVGQLDDIKAQIGSGVCDGLQTKVTTFHDDATALPGQVDSRLRKRINEGVKSLQEHALATCRAAAEDNATETTPTETTPTDTTTTETTPTETTPTDTTPTDTTPSDTTPTDTTPSSTTPPTDTGTATTPPTDTSGGDGSADTGGTPGEGQTP